MQALDAQPTFKRTVLQKVDLAGLDRDGLIVLVEIPSGVEAGRHIHPGTELGYLVEGSAVLEVDGRPPATLVKGDSWVIEPGRPHNARGAGDRPALVVVTYVVEKGKPVASPAP
jgi:quercetin dioxygenase-like cupin family protein